MSNGKDARLAASQTKLRKEHTIPAKTEIPYALVVRGLKMIGNTLCRFKFSNVFSVRISGLLNLLSLKLVNNFNLTRHNRLVVRACDGYWYFSK